jgi:hypothetical protein
MYSHRESYTIRQVYCCLITATAGDRLEVPATSTGLVAIEVLPMPSLPSPLAPQHLTPPPDTMMHVWVPPKAMAMVESPGALKFRAASQRFTCEMKTMFIHN